MAHQTVLPPSMYGMDLIHSKVLWRRAETQARRRNYLSVSGASVNDVVPGTNSVFHPLRPSQVHLWILEILKLLYCFVGFGQALFLG